MCKSHESEYLETIDTLNAAITYATTLGLEAAMWLYDWQHGDTNCTQELDDWREKQNA